MTVDLTPGPVEDQKLSVPRCDRCDSPRWVSVSLDGGWTRRAQCVPCGAYHSVGVIGPGWKSPNYYRDTEAEHPAYRASGQNPRTPGEDATPVSDSILPSAHWTVTVADPPMPGVLHHWVLTPHERVTDIHHLREAVLDSLWCLLYNLTAGHPGYSWATRAGDPQATGGPVGVVDVVVGDPDAVETARYVMSGRAVLPA